jgi:UDP-3-O-[3-hydroxymyristoyl] glucosamine N-acyltransferase
MTTTLAELSEYLNDQGFPVSMEGPGALEIRGVNTLEDACSGELGFLANPKYRKCLAETRASAVLVHPDETVPEGLAALRCPDPYGAMAAAIVLIHGHRQHPCWNLDPAARIAASVHIGANPNIGPYVVVSEHVRIGANVTLYPGCYLGPGVVLGDDVTLYPNVVVYDGTRIGDRVTLHAGTVLGQDGLGYAPVEGRWLKIPQAGRVTVEDDVEMGANCAIDRATLGETRIGAGTKFSDAVVIGHGTKVGRHGMFVAQAGLAGSVTVGDHVTMGGQVGVAGHLHIGDGVTVGAKSGVWTDIPAGERYFGLPATRWKQFWRQIALLKELPELHKRLRRLEAELESLRGRLQDHD